MPSSMSMPILALICVACVTGLPATNTSTPSVSGVDQVRGPEQVPLAVAAQAATKSTTSEVQVGPTGRELTFATMPTHDGAALPERMTYSSMGFFDDIIDDVIEDLSDGIGDALGDIGIALGDASSAVAGPLVTMFEAALEGGADAAKIVDSFAVEVGGLLGKVGDGLNSIECARAGPPTHPTT